MKVLFRIEFEKNVIFYSKPCELWTHCRVHTGVCECPDYSKSGSLISISSIDKSINNTFPTAGHMI